jgi:hypothetical protein
VRSAKCEVQSEERKDVGPRTEVVGPNFSSAVLLAVLLAISFGAMLLAVDQAPLDPKQLETMSARFHPVDISANVSGLPASEQRALALMVKASL